MAHRRRRPSGTEIAQKGKAKKRGAGWHKGCAQGIRDQAKLEKGLSAFEQAALHEAEVAAQAAEHRDYQANLARMIADLKQFWSER